MKSHKTTITLSLLAVLVLIAVVYFVLVPLYITRQYTLAVHAAVDPIKGSYKELMKSTELPIVANQDTSDDVKRENIQSIVQLIEATKGQLDDLKEASDRLTMLPYSDALGQYRDAQLLKNHTKSFIGQSEEVVSGYRELILYLEAYQKAMKVGETELHRFNQVVDLNIYSGQAEEVAVVAATIRAEAASLSKVAHPAEMESVHDATIAALNEAANGFDDLAAGLRIPADGPIYSAAGRLENATKQLEGIRWTSFENSVRASRAMKNLGDLEDKLNLVLDA